MVKLALALVVLFYVGLGCHQKSVVSSKFPEVEKTAAEKPVENKTSEPAPRPTISDDQEWDRNVNNFLKEGRPVQVLVIAYAEPGNSDLMVIREKIHEADINGRVDRDLDREREFTDYPFTIDSYLATVNSPDGYQKLLDCGLRYPNVKVFVIPFHKMALKSYLRITYSKPYKGEAPPKILWIGNSQVIDLDNNQSTYNLEDASTYLPYLERCHEMGGTCFSELLKTPGYFGNFTMVDGQAVKPLEYLNSQLAATSELYAQGFTGDVDLTKAILDSTYDKSVVKNISLSHEIWVKGLAKPGNPPEVLLKANGSNDRPIVFKNKEDDYLYMLPVSVTSNSIPARVRESTAKMGTLFSNLQKQISIHLGWDKL